MASTFRSSGGSPRGLALPGSRGPEEDTEGAGLAVQFRQAPLDFLGGQRGQEGHGVGG
jgi:hypothetical protein